LKQTTPKNNCRYYLNSRVSDDCGTLGVLGTIKLFIAFAATFILIVSLPISAAAKMSVSRYAFARDVTAREPSGEAKVFPSSVGEVYFFTQLVDIGPAVEIYHVWLHDGVEAARVPLNVEGPSWRTWSKKKIIPQFKGNWTVEVRTVDDEVLLAASFVVE